MQQFAQRRQPASHKETRSRYLFLDELRGFSLLSMILFHLFWNLDNLLQIELAWYHTVAARIWQFSICAVFLLLSGLCIHFTHHLVRHIVTLTVSALLVTTVTWFIGPHTLVVFGILHCMCLCFFCYLLLHPILRHIPMSLGFSVCIFLFFLTYTVPYRFIRLGSLSISLPQEWYTSYWLSPIGFLSPDFYSSDYFPLFPNLFLFLAGYFLGRVALPNWMRETHCRPLAWLGQHSLMVYLLHQPILYLSMLPFFPN